jgi:hypothetical protein
MRFNYERVLWRNFADICIGHRPALLNVKGRKSRKVPLFPEIRSSSHIEEV